MGGRHRNLLRKEKVMKCSAKYVIGGMATTTREKGKGRMTLSAVRDSPRQPIAITTTWSFLLACEQRRCDVIAQPPRCS
jgi:hypothetical protein